MLVLIQKDHPGTEMTESACPVAKVRASVHQDGHENHMFHRHYRCIAFKIVYLRLTALLVTFTAFRVKVVLIRICVKGCTAKPMKKAN